MAGRIGVVDADCGLDQTDRSGKITQLVGDQPHSMQGFRVTGLALEHSLVAPDRFIEPTRLMQISGMRQSCVDGPGVMPIARQGPLRLS